MRTLLLAVVSCLACSGTAIASELDDTVAALRAVEVAEADVATVPPRLVALEARFKRLLRDEAIRALPDVDPGQLDLAALKRSLDALARRYARADSPEGSDAGFRFGAIYGDVLEVRAEHPRGRPDLLAILANVRVGCGQDTSLALLARRQGRWVEVLDVDAGAIRTISDAYGTFDYSVSPVAADGSFVVAHAHVTPWCQSNWRELRHAVARVPAHGAARLFRASHDSIFLGVASPVYTMQARPAGYSLRFTTDGPADDPAGTRACVVDVDVRGDQVRRRRRFAADTP